MTADALIKATHPGRPENILYIIQQAVEKTLRAATHSRRGMPILGRFFK